MRRYLLASTALMAVAFQAQAEDITTQKTAPVLTSTVKSGTADAVRITSAGSVVLTTGTAVTMDSNHSITNQGAITIGNANGAVGVAALDGTNATIDNSGTITIDEPYAPTDTDNDGDLDGPFALGSNRVGIRTNGAHTGKITNTGTITVEGNDSTGILLGGTQSGGLANNGTIKVTGDRAVGLAAQDITGNVRLAGSVSVQGLDAIGARFSGDVAGSLEVQGAITATGYRYTTVPSNTTKLDADDLLQGGSALIVEGDVSGGIILAKPPKDDNPSNADEDGDGIPDSTEGTAKVTSYGAAPAMVIGATADAVTIGPVASTAAKFGLQIDGSIEGNGLYTGVAANGLQIGGRGGAVTIANGVGNSGTISAISLGASATALRVGDQASFPKLQNSGTIDARGGNNAVSITTAVSIDAGAQLPAISNSGTINARAGGDNGTAWAIRDLSGTLTLVENSGAISAAGAKADSGRNIAIDLSANTTGTTVRQTQVGSGIAAPSIKGDVRLGSGNDVLEIADGSFTGDAFLGAGTNNYALSGDAVHQGKAQFGAGNDTMSLAGTSSFVGTAEFGGGTDALSLAGSSYFKGQLVNSASLAVNVTCGTLDLNRPSAMASLNVASGSTLVVTLDKTATDGSLYNITGTANFATGAKLGLRLADVYEAEGSYLVLQAGTLQGKSGLTLLTDDVPFLFKAALATTGGANEINVSITRRTVAELGLNRSEAEAFDAIYAALGEDEDIEQLFLGIADGANFRAAVGQMLPDHAGGTFEGISLGARAFARQAGEATRPTYSIGKIDIVVSTAVWTTDKTAGDTAAYHVDGLGFGISGETDTGLGVLGISTNWLWNQHGQGSNAQEIISNTYELAVYWRGQWDGFTAHGRGSIGRAGMRGIRTLNGTSAEGSVERRANSKWNGTLLTASGGLNYEGGGRYVYFRPAVSFDYVSLDENGYTDSGGGDGFDLIVDDRKSDEFAANGGVAVGIDFTGRRQDRSRNWFRTEVEGGWREIVGGALGSTTAHFEDGTPFTLDPEQINGGWYARLRAIGGSETFEMGGEIGAEDRHGDTALTLRGMLRLGF